MAKKSFPFEKTRAPLLDVRSFYQRQIRFFLYAFFIIGCSLAIGMAGYAYFLDMGWAESFYNAAMILTGMGPAVTIEEPAAQVFAGLYSLFSGVVFLSTVAIMFTPIVHRFLHRMHLED